MNSSEVLEKLKEWLQQQIKISTVEHGEALGAVWWKIIELEKEGKDT